MRRRAHCPGVAAINHHVRLLHPLFLGRLGRQRMYCVFARRADVRLGRLHSRIDSILFFLRLANAQVFAGLVITLRAPRIIAGYAKQIGPH